MLSLTKIRILSLSVVLLTSFTFCSSNNTDENITTPVETNNCPGAVTGAVPTGNNDVLVWADEFNTTGSPCSDNWTYDVGNSGWGNGEKQFYTRNDRDNVNIENGILKITARKEAYQSAEYTSTRLVSRGKFSFVYGKVEVRAKLPDGGGTWPAIWLLGDNISTVGWPACGEIDIMEHVGNRPGWTSSAIHNLAGFGGTYFGEEQYIADVTNQFHVYGINWTPDKIQFTVDSVEHFTYNPSEKNASNWPFNEKQHFLLNIAMGGNLGGAIPANFTESSMEIDYVRVYQ